MACSKKKKKKKKCDQIKRWWDQLRKLVAQVQPVEKLVRSPVWFLRNVCWIIRRTETYSKSQIKQVCDFCACSINKHNCKNKDPKIAKKKTWFKLVPEHCHMKVNRWPYLKYLQASILVMQDQLLSTWTGKYWYLNNLPISHLL